MRYDDAETLLAHAARLVVDEGLPWRDAKRKAARAHGTRAELPSDEALEAAIREHLAIFEADTQPAELRHLRELALVWMHRLAEFHPYLSGAVWRGTANRLSCPRIDLYADDPKMVEIAFLNQGWSFDSQGGERGEPWVLSVLTRSRLWPDGVTLHFVVHDRDAVRGALQPDSQGRSWRGDALALERLLAQEAA